MIYRFDNYSIDTSTYEIRKSGKLIKCEPKVFDLVAYLTINHHRLISREELFQEIWQGREVSDTSLSNHIKSARKLLGDDGQLQNVIKTIHGRGYQFIAPLKEADLKTTLGAEQKLKKESSLRHSLILVSLAAVILIAFFYDRFGSPTENIGEDSSYLIGVLPFINTKPNIESDYFGFAIADRVISELAYQKNINVRASSSIRRYIHLDKSHQQIGSELNVDYLLTGNYLSVDDRIRINIELIEVASNNLIWRSKQIEVANRDAFQLQDIVAQRVLSGLNLTLSPMTNPWSERNRPASPKAYELYLKSIAQPFSTEGHQKAIELLKSSLQLDENYAPSYVQLGNRIRRLEQFSLINTGESHNTLKYYQKALALNKNLLSALSHLAFVYTESNRIDEAMELVLRMLEINPDNAQTRFTLGYILRYAGQTRTAIKEMEKAVGLDPKNIRFRSLVATYSGMAEFEKAQTQLQLYPPGEFTLGWKGILNLRQGHSKEALEYFDQVIAANKDGLWGLVSTVHKAHILNDAESGLVAVHQLEQTNIADSETVFYTAVYYCMLGDDTRCLQSLRKAVDGGYYNYLYIDNSPYWEQVKENAEFIDIYQKAKKKSDAFRLEYLPKLTHY